MISPPIFIFLFFYRQFFFLQAISVNTCISLVYYVNLNLPYLQAFKQGPFFSYFYPYIFVIGHLKACIYVQMYTRTLQTS